MDLDFSMQLDEDLHTFNVHLYGTIRIKRLRRSEMAENHLIRIPQDLR